MRAGKSSGRLVLVLGTPCLGLREDRPERTGNSRLGPREDKPLTSGRLVQVLRRTMFAIVRGEDICCLFLFLALCSRLVDVDMNLVIAP